MEQEFFEIFAEHAARHGLDEALRRFSARIPADELAEFELEYRSRIDNVRVGYPPKIISVPGAEPWYAGPLELDRYWPPLPVYLKNKAGWPEDRLDLLDAASSKIVAFTRDPSQLTFETKGLVVGYVQSGKTTNFTAVIAKAADVGYRLVVVLSGIHNGLRRQTQERLQTQLVDQRADAWFPLTTPERDFRVQTVTAQAYLQQRGTGTVICVVKKNQRVLAKLHRWLAPAAKAGAFGNVPVLVVDDEADQASVATQRINPQIRDLLALFPRRTYIGYTATPFANVLIDPASGDLYPETFILNLPCPDGYFGTEKIFGREAVEGEEQGAELDGYDMVRMVPDDTVDLLRPRGRGAEYGFAPVITQELRQSVLYFWMATAARRCRGDNEHSTMLIHTSMKTAVHESYRAPLERLRRNILASLDRGDNGVLGEMRGQWESETRRVKAASFNNRHVPFDRLVDHLRHVVAHTRVILDNFRSRDRLDYSGEVPVMAIAVGGNTLSRGLTLEGLVVSFFVRAATTYDTLLQMGRWFGFRPGYEDLPRIWMTEQLQSWFRHLATVEHEIRLDIKRYEEQSLSPRDVGVRIRTHPVLNVTHKMGAARIAYASYGGRRVQTRYFRENDLDWITGILNASKTLASEAIEDGARVQDQEDGRFLLREVDVQHILKFLDTYSVHEDSPDLDPRLVTAYIEKENRRMPPSLLRWSVAIMGAPIDAAMQDEQVVEFAPGILTGTISRSKLRNTGGVKADIKTLMSKEDRVVDLDITSAQARRMAEGALVDLRNDDPVYSSRGLLLLYPIDRNSQPDPQNRETRRALEAPAHLIGAALVFPGNGRDEVENQYVQVDTSNMPVDDSEYDDVDTALTADDPGDEDGDQVRL